MTHRCHIDENLVNDFMAAYRQMGKFYRPGAPSDGMGHITVPIEQLDIETEAVEWLKDWLDEEGTGEFFVGYADYRDRIPLMLPIEAARCLNGTNHRCAYKLLDMCMGMIADRAKKRFF